MSATKSPKELADDRGELAALLAQFFPTVFVFKSAGEFLDFCEEQMKWNREQGFRFLRMLYARQELRHSSLDEGMITLAPAFQRAVAAQQAMFDVWLAAGPYRYVLGRCPC